MKKIIISSLLLAVMSGNVAHACITPGAFGGPGVMVGTLYDSNTIRVSTLDGLINALKNNRGKVISLSTSITIKPTDLDKLNKLKNDTELLIGEKVTINGNGHSIDLNGLTNLTIKGDNVKLSNLTIKNSKGLGIQIYNSRNVSLEKVTVEGSKKYGIFVNGSIVTLKDCTTRNNTEGGILISRSRALRSNTCRDSEVNVTGTIKHEEKSGVNVTIKNLQMPISGIMQENKFNVKEGTYEEVTTKSQTRKLSDFYFELLELDEKDRNKEYEEKILTYK